MFPSLNPALASSLVVFESPPFTTRGLLIPRFLLCKAEDSHLLIRSCRAEFTAKIAPKLQQAAKQSRQASIFIFLQLRIYMGTQMTIDFVMNTFLSI